MSAHPWSTHPATTSTPRLTLAALMVGVALGATGCASLRADAGFAEVASRASERLGMDVQWVRSDADQGAIDARVAELLAQPLSADAAVQIALLNNPGLQAAFSELGIADADRVQASRLPNPGFSFGRLTQGADVTINRAVQVDLARLLLLPTLGAIEARRAAQVRSEVTQSVLGLSGQTRKAYYLAVAADETLRYLGQVRGAAQAGAELARRQTQAGNWSALQQAREHSFYADAALNLARATQAQVAARERLTRLMGLWGEPAAQFRCAPRLPDLPKTPDELPDLERTALAQRLDVQAARLGAEQVARQLGLTRATRFVNVLEVGVVRNSMRTPSGNLPVERGYEVRLELPLFDWGEARVAKAEAIYLQALNRTREVAINARSEVREAYAVYRSSHDIARHFRDEIVPLRKRIGQENQLRYNGMLIGVFELIADAREQVGSVNSAIDALRDFWLAQVDLDMAMAGRGGRVTAAAP